MFVHLSEVGKGWYGLFSSTNPGDENWTNLNIKCENRQLAFTAALGVVTNNKEYVICSVCCYPESEG